MVSFISAMTLVFLHLPAKEGSNREGTSDWKAMTLEVEGYLMKVRKVL